jgi:hypothetical protein
VIGATWGMLCIRVLRWGRLPINGELFGLVRPPCEICREFEPFSVENLARSCWRCWRACEFDRRRIRRDGNWKAYAEAGLPQIIGRAGHVRANRWWVFTSQIRLAATIAQMTGIRS